MAEEPKTVAEPTEPEDGGQVVFKSQEDLDAVIQRRIAKERAKYQDYDAIRAEIVKLRDAEQKRKEAELSEVEKREQKIQELTLEVDSLKPHKEWHETWETKETEAIEEEMKELTDSQKALVTSLPLEKRRAAIREFVTTDVRNVNISKGLRSFSDAPTNAEVWEIRNQYGPTSKEYKTALRKLKGA
jgi:hypothetical protein